jgi:hypothetical protein
VAIAPDGRWLGSPVFGRIDDETHFWFKRARRSSGARHFSGVRRAQFDSGGGGDIQQRRRADHSEKLPDLSPARRSRADVVYELQRGAALGALDREKVVAREMPPWFADPQHSEFSNDCRLSQKEIDTIIAWVEGGAQEGDPKETPPNPAYIEGWQIGKPMWCCR